MSQHTPGQCLNWPLAAYGKIIRGDESTSEDQVAEACSPEMASRIVSCLNALVGIDDPASFIEGLKKDMSLATHKLLACGVAARHPDAGLSRRESDYGGKWNSPQAESVRLLRQQRDELLAALEQARADIGKLPVPILTEANGRNHLAGSPMPVFRVMEQMDAAIAKASGGAA